MWWLSDNGLTTAWQWPDYTACRQWTTWWWLDKWLSVDSLMAWAIDKGTKYYQSNLMNAWWLVRSPWSDKKVSGRAGHNSVALPTAEGRREGDRICPALTEIFKSLQGDLHSTAVPWRRHLSLLWWGEAKSPPEGASACKKVSKVGSAHFFARRSALWRSFCLSPPLETRMSKAWFLLLNCRRMVKPLTSQYNWSSKLISIYLLSINIKL